MKDEKQKEYEQALEEEKKEEKEGEEERNGTERLFGHVPGPLKGEAGEALASREKAKRAGRLLRGGCCSRNRFPTVPTPSL